MNDIEELAKLHRQRLQEEVDEVRGRTERLFKLLNERHPKGGTAEYERFFEEEDLLDDVRNGAAVMTMMLKVIEDSHKDGGMVIVGENGFQRFVGDLEQAINIILYCVASHKVNFDLFHMEEAPVEEVVSR